jgi:hypothetical protein
LKKKFTYSIALFFIFIFIANGITGLLCTSGYIVNKIVVTADTETEDQQSEKNTAERENTLFCEKHLNIIPPVSIISVKEHISSRPAMWRNITLPVFTPPPEVA